MADRQIKIPRPPPSPARVEFPAVIEPPLRDIPEYAGLRVEGEAQRVEVERSEDVAQRRFATAAREVALADERVQRELGERYAPIGVSRLVDDKESREPATVFVAYSYSSQRASEVWLDGDEGDLRVSEIRAVDYQPPPSEEELARAVELAGERLSERLEDGFESTAILASDVEPGDRHYGTRRIAVGFGPPDERQPRIAALVDLGRDAVLAVTTRRIENLGAEAP